MKLGRTADQCEKRSRKRATVVARDDRQINEIRAMELTRNADGVFSLVVTVNAEVICAIPAVSL